MSSDMKDARWGLAMTKAEHNNLDRYNLRYEERDYFLTAAQMELDAFPDEVEYWAGEFRSKD